MEEMIKDYILKQYESIGNLHKTLNDINEYVTDDPNGQLCLMTIECYKRYREDWLYVNGLEMSSEECDMWKKLPEEVASMFRT